MEIVEEYEKIRVRSKGFFVLNDREGNLLASGCRGEKFVAKMNEENGEYETEDSEGRKFSIGKLDKWGGKLEIKLYPHLGLELISPNQERKNTLKESIKELFGGNQPQSRYELKNVVCDYGIYEENKLVLILNDYVNAENILKILKEDEENKRAVMYER